MSVTHGQAPNWPTLDSLIARNRIIDAKQLVDSIVTNHPYQVNAPFNFRRAEVYYQLYKQSHEAFGLLNAEWLYQSCRAFNAALVVAAKTQRITDGQLTALKNYVAEAKLHGRDILDEAEPNLAYLVFKEAEISLSLWHQINKTKGIDRDLLYYRAISSDNFGKLQDAKLSYDALLRDGVKTREVYRNLANVYKELNDYASAIYLLEKAVVQFPDDKDMIVDWVQFSILSDMEEQLLVNLEKIVKRDSLNPSWYIIMGSVYDDLARYPEAERFYLKALQVDSTQLEVQYNLATMYYNMAIEQNKLMIGSSLSQPQRDSVRQVRNQYYGRALPYFEQARPLDPVSVDRVVNQIKSIRSATTR